MECKKLHNLAFIVENIENLFENEILKAFVIKLNKGFYVLNVYVKNKSLLDTLRLKLSEFLIKTNPNISTYLSWNVIICNDLNSALRDNDVYITNNEKGMQDYILRAWKQGKAVINTKEHVEAFLNEVFIKIATDVQKGDNWYAIMEGNEYVIKNPNMIDFLYGSRINPRAVIINSDYVYIGKGTLIGADCQMILHNAKLRMGNFTHVSSHVTFIGSRHTVEHPSTYYVPRGPFKFLGVDTDKVGDISIGNDVWIGANVSVMPGVRIADGCIVGTASVVTKDVTESYGIYVGNPARLIKYRFREEIREFLLTLKWWNWSTDKLYRNSKFFKENIAGLAVKEIGQMLVP